MPLTAGCTLRVALVAVVALAAPAAPVAGQTDDVRQPVRYTYDFGLSSVPMIRNAEVFTLAGALADRGVNTALDAAFGSSDGKRGARAISGRLARLWLVDTPIACLSTAGNHEFGHVARADWPGGYVMHVTSWPWPVPMMGLEVWKTEPPPGPLSELAAIAGGVEADFVNAERTLDRLYSGDRASPFDLAAFTYAKAHRSLYVFFGFEGDPASLAGMLAYVPGESFDEFDARAMRVHDTLNRGAWLNLLDYALFASVERVIVDYVVRGDSVLEPGWLKVGRLRVVPSVNYVFTPRGPQYQVGSRIGLRRGFGNVYVRWTDPLPADYVAQVTWQHVKTRYAPRVTSAERLVGAGVQFRTTATRAVAPTFALDFWRDVDGRAGGRLEGGAAMHLAAFGRGGAVRFALGGKTAGYLTGFPDGAGLYVNGGLVVAF